MTDRQAKLIGIEAAWRKSLHSPVFPTLHGSDNLDCVFTLLDTALRQHYHENAARVLVEVLERKMAEDTRRKRCLTLAILAVELALLILAIFFSCVR